MDFVEQVKSQVNIVDVVGEYVRLKKAGGGQRYVGLCPFHTEKTPSFGVHSQHQFYKCFGCGAAGDVFKFVMEMDGLSFFEALKHLAERQGIPMPKRAGYVDAESKQRDSLYDIHETAARLFQANLKGAGGAEAREYLEQRGITPAQMEEFGLGLSDSSGQALVRLLDHSHHSFDEMEASGLVMKRTEGTGFYDRFRGRLMFPIHNESGKIIAFGGRALRTGDEPKYLNSPKTAIYNKSYVLYNLHRAKSEIRKHDRAVLVEGYMDAIGVHSAGVREVIASCGTALTNTQVRALKRHAENIVVNFDPDTAGANASERSIQMLLEEGMHVRVLELAEGLDPDEFVKRFGAGGYRSALEGASGYFYWLADRARAKYDMRSAEGRVAAFKFLLPTIQRISGKLERAAIANDVAGYLGVNAGLILDEFRKQGSYRAPMRQNDLTRNESGDAFTKKIALQEVPRAERILLRSLMTSGAIREQLLPTLRSLTVVEGLATAGLLKVLFTFVNDDQDFDFAAFAARLEDKEKALLESVVFADNSGDEIFSPEQAVAYLERLEVEQKTSEITALKNRLKEAERAGNLKEAFRLQDEISRLKKN